MAELRKLFLLTDENNIKIRTTYIRSAANKRADRLSREQDSSDLQLAKRVFDHLDATFHKHSIDRFASRENKHPQSGGTANPRRWTPYTSPTSYGGPR